MKASNGPGAKSRTNSPEAGNLTVEQYARCQRNWLGADWRMQTAEALATRLKRRRVYRYEPLVLELAEYSALKKQGPRGAAAIEARFALFLQAEQLNGDAAKTRNLMLMTLADLPHQEMARRSGLDVALLQTWESLFFDARGQRRSVTWLSHQIIGKALARGDTELAGQMRLAIALGCVGVEMILDVGKNVPLDDADRLLRRQLKVHLAFERLADIPLASDSQVLSLAKLRTRLMLSEKRIELARENLEARCAHQIRRHQREMERLKHVGLRQPAATEESKSVFSDSSVPRPSGTSHLATLSTAATSPLAMLRWASGPSKTSGEPLVDHRHVGCRRRPHRATRTRSKKTAACTSRSRLQPSNSPSRI